MQSYEKLQIISAKEICLAVPLHLALPFKIILKFYEVLVYHYKDNMVIVYRLKCLNHPGLV